jgi:hypothetical protein
MAGEFRDNCQGSTLHTKTACAPTGSVRLAANAQDSSTAYNDRHATMAVARSKSTTSTLPQESRFARRFVKNQGIWRSDAQYGDSYLGQSDATSATYLEKRPWHNSYLKVGSDAHILARASLGDNQAPLSGELTRRSLLSMYQTTN